MKVYILFAQERLIATNFLGVYKTRELAQAGAREMQDEGMRFEDVIIEEYEVKDTTK